jgi:hypothetical protein
MQWLIYMQIYKIAAHLLKAALTLQWAGSYCTIYDCKKRVSQNKFYVQCTMYFSNKFSSGLVTKYDLYLMKSITILF